MALTINWRGKSGASYTFETYPIGQEFNSVSGLYIFCRQVSGGTWEAMYVGETQSFKDRINTGIGGHDGFLRARNAGATHVAVLLVAGDSERLRIETDLRHGLNPTCNAQSVNALSMFGFRK